MKKYAFILIFSIFIGRVVYPQTTNDILNVLVQRNLVTQEEADSLRADAAIKQQESDAKKKSFLVTAARNIQLSGYTQIRYQNLEESGKKSGFDIRRARIDVRGTISPYFGYRLQPDFAGTSSGAFVKLMDAYAEIKIGDYLNFTLGQQKVALSYENQISDNKSENIDRSQVVEALVARGKDVIGNQNGRDLGIQVNGSLFTIKDHPFLDYYVGLYNGTGINAAADNNTSKDVAVRLVLHPLTGLSLGGSYYNGVGNYLLVPADKTTSNEGRNRWGVELVYESKNLSLHSEYLNGKDNFITKDGYYVQLAYYVISQKFQIITKYDHFDPNKDIADNASTVYTLGLNYYFNPFVKFQIAYNLKREQGPQISNNFAVAQFQIGF